MQCLAFRRVFQNIWFLIVDCTGGVPDCDVGFASRKRKRSVMAGWVVLGYLLVLHVHAFSETKVQSNGLTLLHIDLAESVAPMSAYEVVARARRKHVLFIGKNDVLVAGNALLKAISSDKDVVYFSKEKTNRIQTSRIGSSAVSILSVSSSLCSHDNVDLIKIDQKYDLVVFLGASKLDSAQDCLATVDYVSNQLHYPVTLVHLHSRDTEDSLECLVTDSQAFSVFLAHFEQSSLQLQKVALMAISDSSLASASCPQFQSFDVLTSSFFHILLDFQDHFRFSGSQLAVFFLFTPFLAGFLGCEGIFQWKRFSQIRKFKSKRVSQSSHIVVESPETSRPSVSVFTVDDPADGLQSLAAPVSGDQGLVAETIAKVKKDVQFKLHLVQQSYEAGGRQVGFSLLIVFSTLILCFLHELTPILHLRYAQRSHSMTAYVIVLACLIAFSLTQIAIVEEKPQTPAILNKHQTEEWRGFMQVSFVLYHYFHVTETYNLIRLYIAAYVWMTGFGNTAMLVGTRDFSLYRCAKIILRINMFVVPLMWMMNEEYMLYYICALHTFFSFWVFLSLIPFAFVSKESSLLKQRIVMATCLILSFILLAVVFQRHEVFNFLFKNVGFLYFEKSLHEWEFRSVLDHYASWFGMLVAMLLPQWIKFQNYLDGFSKTRLGFVTRLLSFGILLSLTLFFLRAWVFSMDKFAYNKIHPYIFWIPLVTFLLMRNMFPSLRTRYMKPMAFLGQITLETYLLQHYLWLTDDAKTVIAYIPGYPVLNFIVVTGVFILASYALFRSSCILMDACIPPKAKWNRVALRMSVLFLLVGCAYGLGTAAARGRVQ